MNDSMNGLEHLGDLKAALREALQPLADTIERFEWHSTSTSDDGQLVQVLFDCPATGHTMCCTVPLDGSPATLCRAD